MAVPANLAALSTTAASNPPAGTDAVFPELDNHLRFTYSCLAQLRDERLALTGGTLTGVLTVGGPTVGTARLNPGSASNGGYIAIHLAAGTRQGYIGNGVSGQIPIFAETGTYYNFTNVAPRSAVAAASATELVRKQEMDAAVGSAMPVGSVMGMMRLTAPTGWLVHDNKTIGNASSGGTARANADTQALFEFLWAFDNSVIPIYTSAGALSTRGASAAADFAANKRIALSASAGGHFNEAWTPSQTVDAGRLAGSVANANAGQLPFTATSDDGDSQNGAGKAISGLLLNGQGPTSVFGWADGETRAYTADVVADNSTTKPYSVALPQYIKYA